MPGIRQKRAPMIVSTPPRTTIQRIEWNLRAANPSDDRQPVLRPRYVSATARKQAPVANWLARKLIAKADRLAATYVQMSPESIDPELEVGNRSLSGR